MIGWTEKQGENQKKRAVVQKNTHRVSGSTAAAAAAAYTVAFTAADVGVCNCISSSML